MKTLKEIRELLNKPACDINILTAVDAVRELLIYVEQFENMQDRLRSAYERLNNKTGRIRFLQDQVKDLTNAYNKLKASK